MIHIKEIIDNKELRQFIQFPFHLYKGSKYWIPPISDQEIKTFNREENPIFKDAEARLFIAYKASKVVGRVVAIINWIEVNKQKVRKMRFGWFDFIDDFEVSKALLDQVEAIGKEKQLDFCEGPVGFSNLDKVGVITSGFDRIGSMITWYNHPYYVNHYRRHGYQMAKKYIESNFNFSDVKPEFFSRSAQIIKRRYQLDSMNFKKTKDILPYVDQMFDLFNLSYAKLSSFVAITDLQKTYFRNKFISFVNPEYIKFVRDKDNRLVAFAIVLPSFAKALQKAKGKLFPFGFLHMLYAKAYSKEVTFYLIGISPEYQNKGVTALIFNEYYKEFKSKGILMCHRTPELADNHAIHNIWKHFNPTIVKERATFKKIL